MIQKAFTILIGICLFFSLATVASAATDYFPQIQNLTIGQVLPDRLLSTITPHGNTQYHQQNVSVFILPSSLFSNPHILYLSSDNHIVFLQLTIPIHEASSFQDLLKSKGQDGLDLLPKTKSEMMYSYPQDGIAFIVNGYSNHVMRVQKFAPESVKNFEEVEGRHFQPIPEPSISSQLIPSPTPMVKKPEITKTGLYSLLGILGLGLAAGTLVLLRLLNRKLLKKLS